MKTLFSEELQRQIFLLLLGALLTGIGIPLVKMFIDSRSTKRQKIFESELARQKEIIDAQIQLLSDFSRLTWEFVFELFKVSYAFAWESEELQQKTYNDYGPVSWEILAKIRSTISSGSRLTSNEAQLELKNVYDWLIGLDDKLCLLADDNCTQEEWMKFHTGEFSNSGEVIDIAIERLATDLRLYAVSRNVR